MGCSRESCIDDLHVGTLAQCTVADERAGEALTNDEDFQAQWVWATTPKARLTFSNAFNALSSCSFVWAALN